MRLLFSSFALVGFLFAASCPAFAKPKKSDVEAEPPPAATPNNACGCYRDAQDNCHCEKPKKGGLKCECQGDCEPAGCEEKRAKEDEKKAAEALKRIEEREKKKVAEAKGEPAPDAKAKGAKKSKKPAKGTEE